MVAALHWIVTADERGATLYACAGATTQSLHVEEIGRYSSRWDDFHQHGRPQSLGRGPTQSQAQHFAGPGHEPEEMTRRTMQDLITWIERESLARGIGRLTLFVGPRLLGELRRMRLPQRPLVDLQEGDLAPMHAEGLVGHPAVLAALNLPESRPHAPAGS